MAERLKDETGRSVETIAADLSNKADLARIETTLSTNPSITLLVNNAGVGATAPLLVVGGRHRAANGLVKEGGAYDAGWVDLEGTFSLFVHSSLL